MNNQIPRYTELFNLIRADALVKERGRQLSEARRELRDALNAVYYASQSDGGIDEFNVVVCGGQHYIVSIDVADCNYVYSVYPVATIISDGSDDTALSDLLEELAIENGHVLVN
jgi:hypothetical protein